MGSGWDLQHSTRTRRQPVAGNRQLSSRIGINAHLYMMEQEVRRRQVSSVALRICRLRLFNRLQGKKKIFSQSVALLRKGIPRQVAASHPSAILSDGGRY
jgi:hypothetical protein